MLHAIVFLPVTAALLVMIAPRRTPDHVLRWTWVAVSAAVLALVVVAWVQRDGSGISHETRVDWIPDAGVGYHVGLDGLSLPLVAVTAVLFLACAVYSLREDRRPRAYVALFLFLETASLGLFAALDLILFFLFFDLSIVGMYAIIAGWGHGERGRSALTFFIYTFVGSLLLLLGFIGLYLASDPRTFDMTELTAQAPLGMGATESALILLAILTGLAIKTPVVPFHTWLPPAHVDAPAAGSAILAGVLLKMGTYGFVRIAMPMLPDRWQDWALGIAIAGVVSVVYGALVALAQDDLKRMIAYTSVNHMGYVLLAVGAAGIVGGASADARSLAVTGAVTQMVSHALLTGALFLLAGVVHERAGTYDMGRFGGLAGPAPVFAGLFAVAAFGSLGIPGLSGFIAEFQIFAGSLDAVAAATAVAFLGILITAALFLRALQRMLMGAPGPASAPFADVRPREWLAVAPLLALSLAIGVAPRWLLDLIEPAARTVVELVAR